MGLWRTLTQSNDPVKNINTAKPSYQWRKNFRRGTMTNKNIVKRASYMPKRAYEEHKRHKPILWRAILLSNEPVTSENAVKSASKERTPSNEPMEVTCRQQAYTKEGRLQPELSNDASCRKSMRNCVKISQNSYFCHLPGTLAAPFHRQITSKMIGLWSSR